MRDGFCECGCGHLTNIATRTDESTGRIAGQPNRFLTGHQRLNKRFALPLFERIVRDDDGCWIFTGAKDKLGYGRMGYEGRIWRTHRLAWFLANGDIPEGAHVLHRCDKRACVNPDHLFLGTHADNMADMTAKRRFKTRAKLTVEDVRSIRREYVPRSKDASLGALGRRYGVSSIAILNIVKRRTWAEVGD